MIKLIILSLILLIILLPSTIITIKVGIFDKEIL
jgi:hypothetical protein